MRKCRLLKLLGAITVVLSLQSCVDERYDMDNVSSEVHLFENGVDMPLLSTGDMTFDDLISSEDDIYVNSQGLYEFTSTEGHFDTDVEIIPKFKVPLQNLDFGTIKSIDATIPVLAEKEYRVVLPQDITTYTANLNIESGKVDSRVIAIDSAFVHKSWISELTLTVSCEDKSSANTDVVLKKVIYNNYKLSLPADIILDKKNIIAPSTIKVETDNNSNDIIISGEIENSVLKVGLGIKGIHSEKNLLNENNQVIFDEKVDIGGDITLIMTTGDNPVPMSFKVIPTMYIPEVEVDEVFGKADLDINETTETIYINSLPSFLTDGETSLSLYNPYLPVEIESTLPMFAAANIKLYPKDKEGKYIYDDNGEQIVIEVKEMSIPGDDHDVDAPSHFYEYVAPYNIEELDSKGYDFVECANLGRITEQIPYSIEVVGIGYNDPTEEHDFFLGEPYNVDIKYKFNVPFFLNGGSKIQYNDSTLDLNTDIFETISAKTIFANTTIKNGFPAEMEIFAELCDVNGDKLDGIEVIVPKKINASQSVGITEDIVPAETKMKIEFRETKPGQMRLIDRINWKVSAYFPDKGAISKYQSLNIKVDLELPEGVSIDLDNL